MRDSFVFYRTFYETAQLLGKADRLQFYEAVMHYGVYGEDIAEKPIIQALMVGVRMGIDKAEKRFRASVENGKKGGRPKGVGKAEDGG